MEVKVDRLVRTVEYPSTLGILLILMYNLALLAGAGYLVYYKDASAWLFVLVMVFGASWKNKEDIA